MRSLLHGVFSMLLLAGAAIAVQPGPLAARPPFSDWSVPVNLGAVVNSTFAESAPALSKDRLSLYFHSDRPGFGANDIWVSRRNSEEAPWGVPQNLGAVVNTSAFEARPSLSRDGHWLFFNSTRTGGNSPGQDLWASYREHVHGDFGWQPPINLGPGVNAAGSSEIEPSYFENDDAGVPQLFFTANKAGGLGGMDIYVTQLLPDGTWSSASSVPGLNTALTEQSVDIRFDGLEIFFVRGTPPAAFDVWVATRQSPLDPWSMPATLGSVVNTASSEVSPHIASDRQALYFESNRPGGFGGADLWMTSRPKKNGK